MASALDPQTTAARPGCLVPRFGETDRAGPASRVPGPARGRALLYCVYSRSRQFIGEVLQSRLLWARSFETGAKYGYNLGRNSVLAGLAANRELEEEQLDNK